MLIGSTHSTSLGTNPPRYGLLPLASGASMPLFDFGVSMESRPVGPDETGAPSGPSHTLCWCSRGGIKRLDARNLHPVRPP